MVAFLLVAFYGIKPFTPRWLHPISSGFKPPRYIFDTAERRAIVLIWGDSNSNNVGMHSVVRGVQAK